MIRRGQTICQIVLTDRRKETSSVSHMYHQNDEQRHCVVAGRFLFLSTSSLLEIWLSFEAHKLINYFIDLLCQWNPVGATALPLPPPPLPPFLFFLVALLLKGLVSNFNAQHHYLHLAPSYIVVQVLDDRWKYWPLLCYFHGFMT